MIACRPPGWRGGVFFFWGGGGGGGGEKEREGREGRGSEGTDRGVAGSVACRLPGPHRVRREGAPHQPERGRCVVRDREEYLDEARRRRLRDGGAGPVPRS